MEIDPEACAASEAFPAEYAAPDEYGYREDFTAPDSQDALSCGYWGGSGYEALDGLDSIVLGGGGVDFFTTDGSSPWPPESLSGDLDFNKVPEAAYFEEWKGTSHRFKWEDTYFMEDSKVFSFTLFTSLDNLYVNANLYFVVPKEFASNSSGSIPEQELAEASYEILDVIVPPVVDGLERE
ncbi:hypothetical protein O1R50_22655 [Glycomyces luteolus]|uniref:Uncharacterized protein n=1 Tax=Glycomyces luteolus TaxID=2670330 RepID=A0A9X3SVG1_9ACTN|nr:hypothetical protein [Glycomyces luteolus]MDA1362443.1 hypothetical protein [Glycomyces luteolus]